MKNNLHEIKECCANCQWVIENWLYGTVELCGNPKNYNEKNEKISVSENWICDLFTKSDTYESLDEGLCKELGISLGGKSEEN